MRRGDLTGNFRCRLGWFGKLIVQVEHVTLEHYPGTGGRGTDWHPTGREWRDAKVQDLPTFMEPGVTP